MNNEPLPPGFAGEPMDTQLMQLERELFSLTPVEAPRYLRCALDGQLDTGVPRTVALPAQVVPFKWRRIVVPAAAAVVAVSVLNHTTSPSRSIPSDNAQAGVRALGRPAVPVLEQTTGYVLRSEPVYVNPVSFDAAGNQYFIRQEGAPAVQFSVPRRQSALMPVSFH
jgi:hypothetical protein